MIIIIMIIIIKKDRNINNNKKKKIDKLILDQNNLAQWSEASGSQLHNPNTKIETRIHRSLEKVIFIHIKKKNTFA